jgi:aspartate racemase
MKTIGILGGMSWESTAEYYRRINEQVKAALGGLHSAQIAMVSVDFDEIEAYQRNNDWTSAGRVLGKSAAALETAGADFIVLATNTMHKVADAIEEATRIPLLHIADATAEALKKSGVSKAGLLGTRFTMEETFYKGRLVDRHGLEVIVPEDRDREFVHRVILDELVLGSIRAESRRRFVEIIEDLSAHGAGACILGCTEIGLLVGPDDTEVPVFDTATIHADRAVVEALESP